MITIPNEIRKSVDGVIERFENINGDFELLLVTRDCPYCHMSYDQPALHVAIHSRINTTYICPRCSTYYYFVGDNIYQFIPEAQLLYLPDYRKKPSRLDTIKDYRSLYHRAKAFRWYDNIDLSVLDHIIEGTWTMPVEVAAQMTWKEDHGKAPGYCIAEKIVILEEDPDASNIKISNINSEAFLEALNFLREKRLVE